MKPITIDYKSLLKGRGQTQVSADGDEAKKLLSSLTPTELANLFPDYYKKGLPDVSGFEKATSRKHGRDSGYYNDLSQIPQAGTASQVSKRTRMDGFGAQNASKSGSLLERQTTSRVQQQQQQKFELPDTEKENFRTIQKGKSIQSSDPRANYLNKMSQEQLDRVGIQKVVGDPESGSIEYKAKPTKTSQMSDEEILKQSSSETGGNNSPLTNLIAQAESGRKGYNAYNRGTAGGSILSGNKNYDFENMTIGELTNLQSLPPGHPDRVFAAGKYQVIPSTMRGAIKELGLDPNQKFDRATQDRILRDYLLGSKRPAVDAYITGKSDNKNAAIDGLGREFASFAGSHGSGFYGDGNKVSVGANRSGQALEEARKTFLQAKKEGKSDAEARLAAFGVQPSLSPNASPDQIAALRQSREDREINSLLQDYSKTAAQTMGTTADTFRGAMRGDGVPQKGGSGVAIPVKPESFDGWHNPTDVDNRVTSEFGTRRHPLTGGTHNHSGVDIAPARDENNNNLPNKNNLYAARDGVVISNKPAGGYGNHIVVEHTLPDGRKMRTSYSHMADDGHIIDEKGQKISLKEGDTIKGGQRIGTMGSTGSSTAPHLHFETSVQNPDGSFKKINPKEVGVFGKTLDGRVRSIESILEAQQKQQQTATAQPIEQKTPLQPSSPVEASAGLYVSGKDGNLNRVPEGGDPAAARGLGGLDEKPKEGVTTNADAPPVQESNVLQTVDVVSTADNPTGEYKDEEKVSDSEEADVNASGGSHDAADLEKIKAFPIEKSLRQGNENAAMIDMTKGKPLAAFNTKEGVSYDDHRNKINVTPVARTKPDELREMRAERETKGFQNQTEQRQQGQQNQAAKPPYSPDRDFTDSVVPTDYVVNSTLGRQIKRIGFVESGHYNQGSANFRPA